MIATMVEDYKDRLIEAMSEMDPPMTPAQLAREMRISYQAVAKVLAGGRFGTENNFKAAKKLRVRSDWLAEGKGPKRPGPAEAAAWVFTDELLDRVLTLSDDALIDAENVLRAHLHIPTIPLIQSEDARTARIRQHFHRVTAGNSPENKQAGKISPTVTEHLIVGKGATTDERRKAEQVQEQRRSRRPKGSTGVG